LEDDIKMYLREREDKPAWTGLIWLRMGQVEGPCEHGNEPLGSINYWEILE
jgi:hypothetical protein